MFNTDLSNRGPFQIDIVLHETVGYYDITDTNGRVRRASYPNDYDSNDAVTAAATFPTRAATRVSSRSL